MRIRRIVVTSLVVLGAAASLALTARALGQPSISQRASSVSATIINSPKLYNGSYAGSLKSRMCGETDPMYTGRRTYLFEYPDIDDPRTIKGITDVRFFSDDLVGQARETKRFFVSITVSPAGNGGSPPAYVADTTRAGAKDQGSATLSIATNGTATLTVKAMDALGQSLNLTVTCGPK